MFLFWFIILAVVLVLSFLLATRSMRNSAGKIKPPEHPQSLYLLRNPELINEPLLEKLHQILSEEQTSISFEKLFKGPEKATTIYGPQFLPGRLPELNLLELEDYLIPKEETFSTKDATKVNADQAFVWVVPVEAGMGKPDFSKLQLKEEEQFFYQVILKPIIVKESNFFKITIRGMAATPSKLDKVKLAKKIFADLGIDSEKLNSSPQAFEKFLFRLPEGEKNFTLEETSSIMSY